MNLASVTRVRLLTPWRQTSARPVPTKLPLHPAELTAEDVKETKIWDAHDLRFPDREATASTSLGSWFVYAPWMHMAWAWHYCGLVHLRDVPNKPPAKKTHQRASHEFMVFALDPSHDVVVEALRPLTPASIVQQFEAVSDAHARLIVEDVLELVARGKCSVDSDFRRVWQHLLCECDERPLPP